jgi:hypothetical protein
MKKLLVVGAVCLAAVVAVAAPRPERLRMPSGSLTNSFEIAGVKFPPRYTEEQFRMCEDAYKALKQELKRISALAEETFQAQLTDEHRKVLLEISRQQEEDIGRMRAEAAVRNAELVAITNRKAYVVKEYHEKRRSEYHYQPKSLYWLGDEVFKETVTRAEKGKVVVNILYTRDKDGKEKRHRYDPYSIERRLQDAAKQNAKGGVK